MSSSRLAVVIVGVGLWAAGCGLLGGGAGAEEAEAPRPATPAEPERTVACEVDAGLAGLWTDARGGPPRGLAVHDQRDVALWLGRDGGFWLSSPGWSLEVGEWGSCSGEVELTTTERIEGEGGGVSEGQVLGVICRARELSSPRRRTLTLSPCAAPDGSDGPCLQLEGTVLLPAGGEGGLDPEEIRPLCHRGDEEVP